MRKLALVLSIVIAGVCYSQSQSFLYKEAMTFAIADSLVSPYLCTVDSSGNVWVVSSNFASATAINGVFKAAANGTVLQLVQQFADKDSVRNVTGITSIGNDIYISARMSAPASYSPAAYYPYSEIIVIPGGDIAKKQILKYPVNAGYGTWYTGLAASKDGYLYFGQSYLVTIGTVDGRKSLSSFGATVGFSYSDWSTPRDPGGNLTYPNVMDLIRDIAVTPQSNYADTSVALYTSRNSSADAGGSGTGGIAVWTGGSQASPYTYHAQRVSDVSSFLALGTSVPYGIAVHPVNKNLYVCGTDSSRKWVKGFAVAGNFAVQMDELPSSTSNDIKDTKGAPFIAPSDVAFTADGNTAYVTDEGALRVFKFVNPTSGIKAGQNNSSRTFALLQNYPNPFNPTTQITFSVAAPSVVKAEVYNTYGEVVSVLMNGHVTEGTHSLTFNAAKLASGIYICKVTTGNVSQSIKMMLLK